MWTLKLFLEHLLPDNLVSPVLSIDLSGEPLGFKGPSVLTLVDGLHKTMPVKPQNVLLLLTEVHHNPLTCCWLTRGHRFVALVKPESNIKQFDPGPSCRILKTFQDLI